jgi:bifunctional polynucleotide phosphatase/kinase
MLYFKYPNVNFRDKKIAGFDMDYTLIKPKSGKRFPVDHNDWEWLYPNVKDKLTVIAKDFQVVVFSNQMGISKGKTTEKEIKLKCKNIQKDINIPIIFLMSTEDDKYRKPRIGLWKILSKENIIKEGSFYVGDAAGRIKTNEYKKDHSDSDRKFAENIGITFYTPEVFFLNEKERKWEYQGYKLDKQIKKVDYPKLPKNNKTIVLVSGLPGSGKSCLAQKLEKKYKYTFLSKDKDKGKFNSNLKKCFESNENIIVEGLLYSSDQRKLFLDHAKQYGYNKILIQVKTDMDLSYHLNYYRHLKRDVKLVPKIVYNIYNKNYDKPLKKDYDEIYDFHPRIKEKVNKYFLY